MNTAAETTDGSAESPTNAVTLKLLTDSDLLDAWSRDRYSAALAALVDRYSVMVLSVCRRRCRSEADADDAFQTTFLYLARNSHKIHHPERLAGWLHRVAQRAAVATLKARKRETEPMVDPPADPDDPLDRLTQRHEAIVLDEELADLPEHYRAALVMHIFDGRTLQNLAEHFGTTVGSIRGRLQRGKQLLARRLRHRGVVPVLAFAAANAWTVSASTAAQAGQPLIDATSAGDLPDPPIESTLLESLLAQGIRLMPSLYTAAGLVGTSALLLLMFASDGTTNGQTAGESEPVRIPAVVGQLGAGNLRIAANGNKRGGKKNQANETDAKGNQTNQDDGGDEGTGQAMLPGAMTQPLVWSQRAVTPEATSAVAASATEALDTPTDFQIATELIALPEAIADAAGAPVLLDDRAIAFAEIDPAEIEISYHQSQVPLRTALRTMLRPHGLRVVVEDEGLVITADPAALVHRNIGTSRWINVDEDAEKRIAEALTNDAVFDFVDAPLDEAMMDLSTQHNIPIVIDERALEDIGLTSDALVNLTLPGVKLQSGLELILYELDLTMTVQRESLVITTVDATDANLLNRIYWLEGTGFAADDFQSIIDLIQTTIVPDTWERVGGPSTAAPLTSSRPALMISTTYRVHQSIDKMFRTLRETHFGRDPVLERIQIPANPSQGGLGGGGMGGGSGMGGGGGFF